MASQIQLPARLTDRDSAITDLARRFTPGLRGRASQFGTSLRTQEAVRAYACAGSVHKLRTGRIVDQNV